MYKDIAGLEGMYQVSDTGEVLSLNYHNEGYSKNLKGRRRTKGYIGYVLAGKSYPAHRLVAEAFIPNPDNLPEVHHKNDIKTDNRVSNLEWVSHKDNMNRNNRNPIRKMAETNKRPIRVFNDSGFSKVFQSQKDAKEAGFKGVNHVLKGRIKTTKGMFVEYI